MRFWLTITVILATSSMVNAKGFMTGVGSAGGVVTSCTAGALDLSLVTGCNMPQFIMGVFAW